MPLNASPRKTGFLTTDANVSGASAVAEERRDTERTAVAVSVRLVGLGNTVAVACSAADVSEGGMCLRAPVESGLQVGQRCELTVAAGVDSTGLTSALAGQHFATVVRTERVIVGASPMIGAGVRFDQPLFL